MSYTIFSLAVDLVHQEGQTPIIQDPKQLIQSTDRITAVKSTLYYEHIDKLNREDYNTFTLDS